MRCDAGCKVIPAFHYTFGTKLPAIVASRALLPLAIDLEPGERPVIWFSANPNWEQTATKLIFSPQTGRVQRPTRFELHQMIGVYRFRVDSQDGRLVPWPKIRRAAGISDDMTRTLVRNGRAVGADPKEWSGTLEPVPLEAVTFQAWNPVRGWVPASLSTEAEAWAVRAARIRHAAASEVLAAVLPVSI